MKQMKKVIKIENRRTDGQTRFDADDMNEWGYPRSDRFTLKGNTSHRSTAGGEVEVITHINMWAKRKVQHKKNAIHVFDAEQFAKKLKEAYDDERQKMTVAELKDECRVLGLKVGGKKADLIARLQEFDNKPTCDLCGDDTHVGFVDDACTFKVCKYCDTDGSTFAPKEWPVEVLNEIGLDRNGDALRGEEE